MPLLTGKQLLIEVLLQEGIDTIFGNPGTTELVLMDALAEDRRIRYVLGLQESIVLGMADGYAQATGNVAMVNLHAAPGLGNAMGMLYNARRTGTPLLITAGQQDLAFAQTEPVLWGDLATMARPLVKWSAEVGRLGDLAQAIHRAVKVALTPPTGPVFLAIPGDILLATGDVDPGAPSRVAPGIRADRSAVDAAAALLARAEAPLLIAGDAITQGDALREVVELAELLGAPVVLEGAQNTATFPSSHPLFKGTLGRLGPALRASLEEHDVLFSIGGDLFTLSLPSEVEVVPKDLSIIHLDNDPWELGKNYPTEIAMQGDPKATLPDIVAALNDILSADDRTRIAKRREHTIDEIAGSRATLVASAEAASGSLPIKPVALMHFIGRVMPADAIIVEETISSRGRMRELIASDDVKSFFSMRGGGIGWGLPGAVGVKLACPDRPVIALVGDGSSLLTCQALWSARHEGLRGLVFIILNNSSYRILKQRTRDFNSQAGLKNQFLAMDLENPSIDFRSLAASFGMAAVDVDTLDELGVALDRGLVADAPLLINLRIDREL